VSRRLIGIFLAAALAVAACGGDKSSGQPSQAQQIQPTPVLASPAGPS
jgi:hypothetical protein